MLPSWARKIQASWFRYMVCSVVCVLRLDREIKVWLSTRGQQYKWLASKSSPRRVSLWWRWLQPAPPSAKPQRGIVGWRGPVAGQTAVSAPRPIKRQTQLGSQQLRATRHQRAALLPRPRRSRQSCRVRSKRWETDATTSPHLTSPPSGPFEAVFTAPRTTGY